MKTLLSEMNNLGEYFNAEWKQEARDFSRDFFGEY